MKNRKKVFGFPKKKIKVLKKSFFGKKEKIYIFWFSDFRKKTKNFWGAEKVNFRK